ncbi:MAG: cysteine desulfurase [Planctomycetes bacterium]|nr:cysteine desulfurase [Planctomycetota bacterium]
MIYFDYNATTPLDPRVADAMEPYLREHHGNPSSAHGPGRTVRAAVDRARDRLGRLIGCAAERIVFTSGGSEANNQALKGVAWARGSGHIIISAVEHPSVANPCRWLETHGFDLTVVGVDSTGCVDADQVRRAVRDDTILISIMLANNEVGTLQPIRELCNICADRIVLHTDAAQAVGKIPVRVDELGCDLLTVAGHKVYAPPGIGALYIREGVELDPLIHGAGHEKGRRAGTEAVPAIVGLGAAAELVGESLGDGGPDRVRALRDRFHQRLINALGDGLVLNGPVENRLPNTLNVGFSGQVGVELLAKLPGICASPGAACHSDRPIPSAVLQAMGVSDQAAVGAVRFSFGRFNTEAEIDRGAEQVIGAVKR